MSFAKTFDSSIGFFWKADHQQILPRALAAFATAGHIQGREVVQSGKPNKLVYTLTSEGRAALAAVGGPAEQPVFDQGRTCWCGFYAA